MDNARYRIIDANFNRAREACRVMEEFCRFSLNARSLSARCKKLRHDLSRSVEGLGLDKLITARDSAGDVGSDLRIENQMKRQKFEDCFTAAAKRLPEALRVLTETISSEDAQIGGMIESLRFEAYGLEKDISLFAEPARLYAGVRLYVIISSCDKQRILSLTRACAAGGADCIQLRAKTDVLTNKALLQISNEFTRMCRDLGVLSIINDRADIAISTNADGIHLGQDDIPLRQVRRIMLKPMILGLSTHNMDELREGVELMPTYVGIGSAFETVTKPKVQTGGPEYISMAIKTLNNTGIGHAAIGGITRDNVGKLIDVGVRTVAVCREIMEAADPEAVCMEFKKLLETKKL